MLPVGTVVAGDDGSLKIADLPMLPFRSGQGFDLNSTKTRVGLDQRIMGRGAIAAALCLR
jgi:hypothetical protein